VFQDLRIEPNARHFARIFGAVLYYNDKNRSKITKQSAKAVFRDPALPVQKNGDA